MPRSSVVAKAISGASQQIEATGVNYYGYSLRETAGAVATIRIRNGGVTGVILDTLAFAANESKNFFYDDGIRADQGLYVQVVAGTVEGSVRVG